MKLEKRTGISKKKTKNISAATTTKLNKLNSLWVNIMMMMIFAGKQYDKVNFWKGIFFFEKEKKTKLGNNGKRMEMDGWNKPKLN